MRDIIKIVHLPLAIQSECCVMILKLRIIFVRKENISPPRHQLNANCVLCSVSAAPHGYIVFVQIYFITKTEYPCGAADTEQRTPFAKLL